MTETLIPFRDEIASVKKEALQKYQMLDRLSQRVHTGEITLGIVDNPDNGKKNMFHKLRDLIDKNDEKDSNHLRLHDKELH